MSAAAVSFIKLSSRAPLRESRGLWCPAANWLRDDGVLTVGDGNIFLALI